MLSTKLASKEDELFKHGLSSFPSDLLLYPWCSFVILPIKGLEQGGRLGKKGHNHKKGGRERGRGRKKRRTKDMARGSMEGRRELE